MEAGTVLAGRFRIERLLGRGGMAAVYEATQLDLKRRVALKLLATESDAIAAIEREARAAAQLAHPHIVQVTEVCKSHDGPPFLVMELLDGESLDQRIASGGPLTQDRAAFIAVQVLSALASAHASGIIHRDVKPANVFLARTAATNDFVKLLDFGVARRTTGVVSSKRGAPAGTPAYMSPEQISGSELDERTDIWAVGVLLYEMLSGVAPFDAPNIPSLLVKICEAEPPAIGRSIHRDLERIVQRAMQKDRANRYANAEEMRIALAPFASAGAVPSRAVDIALAPTARVPNVDLDVTVPGAFTGTTTQVDYGSKPLRATSAPTLPSAPSSPSNGGDAQFPAWQVDEPRSLGRSLQSFGIGIVIAGVVLGGAIAASESSRNVAPIVKSPPAPPPKLSCTIENELEPWVMGKQMRLRMAAHQNRVLVAATHAVGRGDGRLASASLNTRRLEEWNIDFFRSSWVTHMFSDASHSSDELIGALVSVRAFDPQTGTSASYLFFDKPPATGKHPIIMSGHRVTQDVRIGRVTHVEDARVFAGLGVAPINGSAQKGIYAEQLMVTFAEGVHVRSSGFIIRRGDDLEIAANKRALGAAVSFTGARGGTVEVHVIDLPGLQGRPVYATDAFHARVTIFKDELVLVTLASPKADALRFTRLSLASGTQVDRAVLGEGELELPEITADGGRFFLAWARSRVDRTEILVGSGEDLVAAFKAGRVVREVSEAPRDLRLAAAGSTLWLGWTTMNEEREAVANVVALECP